MSNRGAAGSVTRLLFALGLLISAIGCVHKIHVSPVPPQASSRHIPRTVHVLIPFLSLQGADHMPGIAMFEWPAQDLQTAAIAYLRQRQTFKEAGAVPGDLTLTIKAWLAMRSRGEYRYALRLESDLGLPGKPPIKSYVVEEEETGSQVRWTTSSDQDPIERAVQRALDELATKIESDASLFQ